jgi:hypothetical protein
MMFKNGPEEVAVIIIKLTCIVLILIGLFWIGSCAYRDFQEFKELKPKCEAVGGRLHKLSGEYICVKDLLRK